MLLNAFLARYLSLFPLISFTSHHHQAANLSHVSHCIIRTKYGRGLNINSICFVSHPFWPLNEIFQDCSDCRNVICIYVHDQIKYFKIKNHHVCEVPKWNVFSLIHNHQNVTQLSLRSKYCSFFCWHPNNSSLLRPFTIALESIPPVSAAPRSVEVCESESRWARKAKPGRQVS